MPVNEWRANAGATIMLDWYSGGTQFEFQLSWLKFFCGFPSSRKVSVRVVSRLGHNHGLPIVSISSFICHPTVWCYIVGYWHNHKIIHLISQADVTYFENSEIPNFCAWSVLPHLTHYDDHYKGQGKKNLTPTYLGMVYLRSHKIQLQSECNNTFHLKLYIIHVQL